MGIHLRTTGVACHMGSHSVTCHLTQANTPRMCLCVCVLRDNCYFSH